MAASCLSVLFAGRHGVYGLSVGLREQLLPAVRSGQWAVTPAVG